MATTAPLRRDLSRISWDGVLYCVMMGSGEFYIPAFALALGLGEVASGLVATVPLGLGAVLQLVVPSMVLRLGSQKRWVLLCATVQASSFVPLIAGAALGWMPAWWLFVVATFYWAAAMGAAPAWNSWVGSIIPARIRPRYFGGRSRLCHVGTVIGLVIAGLATGLTPDRAAMPFALVFAVAAAMRYTCLMILGTTSEPTPIPPAARRVPPRELALKIAHHADGRLILYLVAMQASIRVAEPFLTAFMLEGLRISDRDFAILLGVAYAARIIAPPTLGRIAQRYGARMLVWIGAVGLVPAVMLWTVSGNFAYLVLVQVFSGLCWAAYDLGAFLTLFETIRTEERTSLLTYWNLGNAWSMVAGSVLGGLALHWIGPDSTGYAILFAVSAVLRAGSLVFLARVGRARPAGRAADPLPAGEGDPPS